MATLLCRNSTIPRGSAESLNKILLIWGAGGHGKVVFDIARNMQFEEIIFVDDAPEKAGGTFCGCPVINGGAEFHCFAMKSFVVAVGENAVRARCFQRALGWGLLPVVLVHSAAVVAASASIGRGTVVMPGAIVNAGAAISEDCIINSGAVVEHDCMIDAHVHISPRVALGGGVSIGRLAHVGIGAVVLPGARIGEESVVGAGAVVLKEAPPRSTVVGVPARVVSSHAVYDLK